MIYQPRNVQPSGVSIDGLLDNTFTMEIQTNSYVSAYQLLIVDFDNNEVYTGAKTTLAKYAYNGDTLEIPVSASAVALSNGTNYKWRVRLYQPTADMLITYGLVQATSTTTTIYLQPNINIKAGMAITINSQTKTISSYNSDTGVAVVSSAFSSAPAVGTQYKIYSDFIETTPDYIVYARRTPAVAISNVPSSLTLKYHTFQGTYTQSDNVAIVYHQFDLYTQNDDGTISLVASSDKVYSANLSYTYDSFRTGNKYLIQMTVENDMGVISTTDMYEFTVSYDIVEYLQRPLASFDDKNNAVKVSWMTPVEHDATSFRSDAPTGTIQDNSDTFTQATFEPGQSIGEGDVVQTINSDFDMILYGKSEQETRSGKNLYNVNDVKEVSSGIVVDKDDWIIVNYDNTNGTSDLEFNYFTNISNKINTNVQYAVVLEVQNASNTELLLNSTPTTTQFNGGYHRINNPSSQIWLINTYEYFSNKSYMLRTIAIVKAGTIGNIKFRISILKDTSITLDNFIYEPYGVMPSPDYPSEIESVGYENLFNKDNANILDNIYIGLSSLGIATGAKTLYISCLSDTTYTVSRKAGQQFIVADTNTIPKNTVAINNRITNNTGTNITITTSSDAKYLVVFYYLSTADTLTEEEIRNSIKIEKGSVAHSYIPYGKYGIEVKNTGKNLFNKDNTNYTYSNGTSLTIIENGIKATQTKAYSNAFQCIDLGSLNDYAGKTITLSFVCNSSTNEGRIYIGKSNVNQKIISVIKDTGKIKNGNYNLNFTVPSADDTYKRLFLAVYSNGSASLTGAINNYVDYTNIQLEEVKEGQTEPTSYEPYKENTSLIVLNEPLRSLPNGTKDVAYIKNNKLYVDRKIGSIVLNGSESWGGINNKYYINGTNYKTYSNGGKCISNYFTYVAPDSGEGIWIGDSNFIIVYNSNYSNVDDFKTWLSTHNTEVLYELAEPEEFTLQPVDISSLKVDGKNYLTVNTNIDSTFDLVYPYKTITGNTNSYTLFNPAGAINTGVIKSYNALTGAATLMADRPLTYVPMKGDSYAIISNIYNVSGFSYLYNTPYNTVNSLYTHGYTATWSTPDGLCVLPDDFNITLQFSPDGNFFYDQNGVYQEVVNLITTETDDTNNEGKFTIKIDKNKLIFVQNPDISLELPFYTNTTQTFVLSSNNVAQINNDYIWDDTATWTDSYTWVEGGTSLERVCNHWWKVQITNTGIKIEEIFPTT